MLGPQSSIKGLTGAGEPISTWFPQFLTLWDFAQTAQESSQLTANFSQTRQSQRESRQGAAVPVWPRLWLLTLTFLLFIRATIWPTLEGSGIWKGASKNLWTNFKPLLDGEPLFRLHHSSNFSLPNLILLPSPWPLPTYCSAEHPQYTSCSSISTSEPASWQPNPATVLSDKLPDLSSLSLSFPYL